MTAYAYAPGDGGLYEILDNDKDIIVGVVGSQREAAEAVQRMTALAQANAIRLERAKIKREIKAAKSNQTSRERCAAVLEDNPAAIASMTVDALVRSVWHEGPRRRRLTLRYAACTEAKKIVDLSPRQHQRLIEALRMSTDELDDMVRLGLR